MTRTVLELSNTVLVFCISNGGSV